MVELRGLCVPGTFAQLKMRNIFKQKEKTIKYKYRSLKSP
jgi:hypothetical protein